ncbi:MAG: CoA-binding protein [Campylobacteraceae bacterium]|nr:CoA-binding protein [Campylobacteraceae bacterium]
MLNHHKLVSEIFRETKTIAIIGLSPNLEKSSHKVAVFLQSKGFKIIPVYPKDDFILEQKVYKTLEDIEERVDMVNVFRKAEFVPEILRQIEKRGDVKTLWLQLGIVNDEVISMAKSLGLNAVQNRCVMIEYKKMENL